MKSIALTGDAQIQFEAAQHLAVLAEARSLEIKVYTGVAEPAEAYVVHAAGGEVWHCGTGAPLRQMVGRIDRVLSCDAAAEVLSHVTASLNEMLAKTPITGEHA